MKNQPSPAMIAGILSGVAAACVCLTIVLALQNHSLQKQLAESRRLWSDAMAATADLRAVNASTSADLSAHRQRLADLQQNVASLEARVAEAPNVSSRPIPVRVFDGTRLVGLGWIPSSPTNRAGLAGEGVAQVFLDRRASGAAFPGTSAAPIPASEASAPSGTAFAYQQTTTFWPSTGWGWGWGWGGGPGWGCDPDDEVVGPADPRPLPAASPPVTPAAPAALPAQVAGVRTGTGWQPALANVAARPTSFPPRIPTAAPVVRRVTVPTPTATRMVAPSSAGRATPSFSRAPVASPTIRR